MRCRLRSDLSYCVIGDHAVFLDVEADRYFRLPDHLERAFLAHAAGRDCQACISMLVNSGILTTAKDDNDASAPRPLGPPLRSACEMPEARAGAAFLAVAEVGTTVWNCRRRIRDRALKEVLDKIVRYRGRCLTRTLHSGADTERRLLEATDLFRRARLLVPIATTCLQDSIALGMFLARRQLHWNLVFGVTLEPFSAHCWLQDGDLALNETVGDAMAHTIIKVV